MQKHLAAITLMLVAACVAMVGATEYEINLVRNPEFLPGMDRQGPKDWAPYYLPGAGRTFVKPGEVTQPLLKTA